MLTLALALVPAWACSAELPAAFQLSPQVLHLRINGLGVNSRLLTSDLEPTGACALLARYWQHGGGPRRSAPCQRAGRWLLITHRTGNVLQTAQLEETSDGSEGFLSEVDPFATHMAGAYPRLPLPVGARIVNAVQSVLGSDSVTQFTIELPCSPGAPLARLRAAARELGWASAAESSDSVVDFQHDELAVRAVALRSSRGCTLVLVEHGPAGSRP
jgi:hypothetical protein